MFKELEQALLALSWRQLLIHTVNKYVQLAHNLFITIFSERELRELRFTFAMLSPVRLSVCRL